MKHPFTSFREEILQTIILPKLVDLMRAYEGVGSVPDLHALFSSTFECSCSLKTFRGWLQELEFKIEQRPVVSVSGRPLRLSDSESAPPHQSEVSGSDEVEPAPDDGSPPFDVDDDDLKEISLGGPPQPIKGQDDKVRRDTLSTVATNHATVPMRPLPDPTAGGIVRGNPPKE